MISELTAPLARAPAEVGGKAASLFRLAADGFDTPPFFVLTAQAYRSHPDGRLSPEARRQVLAAWARLGGEAHAYAVRSSSVAEDSSEDSFAGIFETVLDVRGEDALVAAIELCWASHRSARAGAYRKARAVGDDPAMAVVVQRMVAAEWAGVSFTADPLAQALSVTVVNAVPGLGEALVSGQVNPEEIRVRTSDFEILDRRTPAGQPPLPDGLLRRVVELSRQVSDAAAFPQDLEWAVEGTRLWLLQSRPITTLAGVVHDRALEPWAPSGDPDAADRIWSRAYADEIWTPPVSPLFYDLQHLANLVRGGIERGGDRAALPPDIFKYHRACAYIDATVLERLYAVLPPISRRPGLLEQLPPELREPLRQARWRLGGALARAWLFEVRNGARWGLFRNHRFLERAWPIFLDRTQPLMDTDLVNLDEAVLDAHIAAVLAAAGSIGPECQVAVVYHAQEIKLLLSGLLERWFGAGDQLYGEVSSGLANSRTVEEAQAIWRLAQDLRAAGAANEAGQAVAWAAACETLPASFMDAFESFRLAHRHRGGHYKDVIHPRWDDEPELLWTQVRSQLDAGTPSPEAVNAAASARRRRRQAELLAQSGVLQRAVLRRLFALNEIYASLRDNHRFYYDRIWWLLRRAYLEKGRRLVAAGRLELAQDVFLLCRREIAALASGELASRLAGERIRSRRDAWLATRRVLPPKFLVRGYAPVEEPTSASGATLGGLGASPGEAVGLARVLDDISSIGRVRRGEILVTRQTDPSWSPAFARLGGLVLETGGVLAHGASLCREFGLPCVTAAEGATGLIADGDLVRVSGSLGTVEILERAAAAGDAPRTEVE